MLLLGSAAALAEFFIFDDKKLGFLVVVFGFLLSAAVLLIRRDITEQLSHDLNRVVARIEPDSWRNDAFERAQELTEELREWAEGRRTLSRAMAIPHQVEVLKSARNSMYAIHVALDVEKAIRLWEKAEGNFRNLVETHRRLPDRIEKRRIFVLDDNDQTLVTEIDGRKIIARDWIVDVCQKQIAALTEGGLGVNLRILWRSEAEADALERDLPPDLLIVDRREVVIVDVGSGEYFDGRAFVTPTRVKTFCKMFENYWGSAVPAAECLPQHPPPPNSNEEEKGAV